jgi:Tfp pilus assembly protein PilF
LHKGLNRYPHNTTGRILLGRCYLEQQKYNEAIESFSAVCMADRRNQMAIKMLADIFVRRVWKSVPETFMRCS